MNYISIWIDTDLVGGFSVVIDTEYRGRRSYGNVTEASLNRLRNLSLKIRTRHQGAWRPFYAAKAFGWTIEWRR